ncbi:hypothetical protein LEM8419_01533 [Neolewinella maritima]|uniref:DUF1573 domain-containing protein n=1 Tax=Neolewinella maritima TaxID=1383882 RepID=A0ABM9B018_9BACT|nr:DUF1573 domain-containing protein [Neolewinella maritima]CAH1000380.1 hypothetical protein LEM8419_01533 [Neolewinella maritima]
MHYLLLVLALAVVSADPVEWLQDMTVEVGDTLQHEAVTYTFRFRNLTDAPLEVENVRVGCGCTATEWADTPVAPGAEGSINITYDATNAGFYRKYVKVYFRGHKGGHKLWLEGFVESAE